MSIIRQWGMNPGRRDRWLQHRSLQRMTNDPCVGCGAEPHLGDYVWRQVGTGHFCESCAVKQLGLKPRLAGDAPVTLIPGDQVNRGGQ